MREDRRQRRQWTMSQVMSLYIRKNGFWHQKGGGGMILNVPRNDWQILIAALVFVARLSNSNAIVALLFKIVTLLIAIVALTSKILVHFGNVHRESQVVRVIMLFFFTLTIPPTPTPLFKAAHKFWHTCTCPAVRRVSTAFGNLEKIGDHGTSVNKLFFTL